MQVQACFQCSDFCKIRLVSRYRIALDIGVRIAFLRISGYQDTLEASIRMSGFLSGMKLWGIIFLSNEQLSEYFSHLFRRRTHIQVAKYFCDQYLLKRYCLVLFPTIEIPVLILTIMQKKDSSASYVGSQYCRILRFFILRFLNRLKLTNLLTY